MKGREGPSADLLVCFPPRAHLSLMPKPICSPARPSDQSTKRRHHAKKASTRIGRGGHGSPMLWAKTKPSSSEISEPTSPKVTCAGQIKVRHKAAASCKNWQSVMEEIERIHSSKKNNKRSSKWAEALGFKKEVMQFLTFLRSMKFDFRCLGAFREPEITSDDEDDVEEEEEEEEGEFHESHAGEASGTMFSKWFMVLQENQINDLRKEEKMNRSSEKPPSDDSYVQAQPSVPPPNALLLMRCRSAPSSKNLSTEKEGKTVKEETKTKKTDLGTLMMEERKLMAKKAENLVVMRYDTDFYKISSDIAKETWIVDGVGDLLPKCRSWRR